MSGGVDSAVAAARAAAAGHDVTGVHLALSMNPSSYRTGARGCCTLEDARDARRAADVIGIPFYVWDLAERFRDDVVRDFVDEYARGNTPNPCLRCNEKIKFAAVLDRAVALGFDAVCTGHHARLAPAARPAGQAHQERGPGQGPVVRAGRADQRAARPRHVPARRIAPRPRCAARLRPGGSRWRTSRTAMTCASSPTATPGNSSAASSAPRPARSWTRQAPRSAATTAATASPSASARGCGSATRRRTGGPGTCSTSSRSSGTVTVGPAESLDVSQIEAGRPVWTGCPPPAAPFDCQVQLRAHGDAGPATAWPAARPADPAARAGPRRGPGTGGRAL